MLYLNLMGQLVKEHEECNFEHHYCLCIDLVITPLRCITVCHSFIRVSSYQW